MAALRDSGAAVLGTVELDVSYDPDDESYYGPDQPTWRDHMAHATTAEVIERLRYVAGWMAEHGYPMAAAAACEAADRLA